MESLSVLTRRHQQAAPPGLWVLITGVGALVLLTASVPVAAAVYGVPLALAFLACTAQCAALPLALVVPRTASTLQFAAAATIALSGPVRPGELWPLPVTGIVALTAHLAIIGLRQSSTTAVLTWWGSAFMCIALVLVDPRGRGAEFASGGLIIYTSSSVLVLATCLVYRQRDRVRQQLRQARQDVELEQGRRAQVEERTQIARELHDVVAHSMSVIHMQAATARYRLPDLNPMVQEEMAQIARAAKDAIGEMRQILTVLRDENGDAPTRPAPDLTRLPELIESAERAGNRTQLALAPSLDRQTVTTTVGVTVYRIVQEALSNVVRHAPGASARVDVGLDTSRGNLVVVITNEQSPNTPPVDSGGLEDGLTRTHLGLMGMRERVNLLRGTLEYGPRPDGGFAITARLPLDHEQRDATATAGSRP